MNFGVNELQALSAGGMQSAATDAAVAPSGRFGEWFARELDDVNAKMTKAESGLQRLATGDASSLHDVMIRMEEARLSFQLAVQFRSRVIEAYQDVMRMQV